MLDWQFAGGSNKSPSTDDLRYRAVHGSSSSSSSSSSSIPPHIIRSAIVIELFHNMTLIVDDILDRSDSRRDRATLHSRFGELTALMASGYIVAEGYRIVRDDPNVIELLSELMRRQRSGMRTVGPTPSCTGNRGVARNCRRGHRLHV